MIKYLFLIIFTITLSTSKLTLNLQKTQAVLYTNKQVVLKFVCQGGHDPKSFNFSGVPEEWNINKNDLIIPNFTVGSTQQWSFDIEVTDSNLNFLFQTIKVVFQGFKVQLLPVTLPKTGNKKSAPQPESSKIKEFNFQELIKQYPGLKSAKGTNQSFFGINFDSDSEIIPHIISSANAVYDPKRDGRKITQFQIKRNAALQRQINANKAIANLIHIIQKLTANVNKSKEDKIMYDQEFAKANTASINCQGQLFYIEDRKEKVLNAMKDKKTKIDQFMIQTQFNKQIAAGISLTLQNLVKQRLELEKINVPDNRNLLRLQQKIKQCDEILNNNKGSVDSLIQNINKNNAQIDILEMQIKDSQKRVKQLSTDLDLVRKKIESLKDQLKHAEQEQKEIIKDKSYFERIPFEGKAIISGLKQKNTEFEQEIGKINSQVKDNFDECQKNKEQIKQIRKRLNLSRFNYEKMTELIQEKQKELENVKQNIELLQTSSAQLPIQLATLQMELQKYQLRLNRQIFVCQVAAQELKKTQEKMNAVIQKFNKNTQYLNQAQANLEKARAQKQIADLAVEELISTTTNANLFPIPSNAVPFNPFNFPSSTQEQQTPKASIQPQPKTRSTSQFSTKKQQQIKKPPVKNESKLPVILQMPRQFEVGVISETQKQIYVGNLGSFILRAFKLKIENKYENIDTLYPIDKVSRRKVVSPVSRTAGLSFFSCNTRKSYYLKGTIQSVGLGTVIATSNNKKYSLNISACTLLGSTSSDRFFKKGSTVYFSGNVVFSLPGTTLFNAFEIVIISNE